MLVTSFFGGQAVARNATPSSTGWLAVAAFAFAGALSVCILFPGELKVSAEVGDVVALIERTPPHEEPYRELALTLSGLCRTNNVHLAVLQWIFRAGALALLLEGFLWILFLSRT